MRIIIENYQEQAPHSRKKAIFDAYLPDMQLTLRRLSVVEGKKGPFVSYPAFPEGEDENKVWREYFEFSREKKDEMSKEIMKEIQKFGNLPF